MLKGLTALLVFQLIGETLVHLFDWPVPGPVVGMVLLLLALEVRLPSYQGLRDASSGVLGFLSLLFVPAGVGIVQHLGRLSVEWRALGASLLLSTLAAIAVTGLVSHRLSLRWRGAGARPADADAVGARSARELAGTRAGDEP
jgi:holin-like protein